MSNIDAVNALISAINLDRFSEIEARHNPDVVFTSFRGPILHSSVAVEDWHTTFLRDYQDCNYTDLEYIEQGETVAARATIEAKGYDWRPFTQRVIEVFDFFQGGVSERRLYGMVPDLEMDKPTTTAFNAAVEYPGSNAGTNATAVQTFYEALLSGDKDGATACLADKAVLIDSIYGTANGPANVIDLFGQVPRPLFGTYRVTRMLAGAKSCLVESAIDPARPRRADWVRLVDGKIAVIEAYWMFREIGFRLEDRERHQRQIIMPI